MPIGFADKHAATMGIGRAIVRNFATTPVELPLDVVQDFKAEAMNVNGTLKGSGKIAAVISYDEGATIGFRVGGMPFAALALMTGTPLPAVTGTGAAEAQGFYIPLNKSFPYFSMMARSFGPDDDCVDFYVPKMKIIKSMNAQLTDGNTFLLSPIEGIAVAFPWGAGTELAVYMTHHKTIPATFAFPTAP